MSDVLRLLQQLIRNACVNDGSVESGGEERSVRTLQEFFGEEGTVFEPAKGRQSLVYRIPGSDPSWPSLGLAPHLDVVPADESGWSVDPFAGLIRDGTLYGRGAVDMLNLTASMSVAVRPYVTGKIQPRGDLVFCALADEEAGGRWGAQPLVHDRWDLVGTDFLLTEVAYPGLPGKNGPALPVAIGEKGAYWSNLHTKGTPSHGSAPYAADNALKPLVEAVVGLFAGSPPVGFDSLWVDFVPQLGLDEELSNRLCNPDTVDEAIDEIAVTDPLLARYIHSATHLTVSPNLIHGGSKTNVIASTGTASLDIRSLEEMDRRFVDLYLRKEMGSAGDYVEIEPVMDMPASASPPQSYLWKVLEEAVYELEGHRRLVPTMMTVATDARFWRHRGTTAYGIGLFDDTMSFSDMLGMFHGHDERVSVASVHKTTTLYETVLAGFQAGPQ